MDILLLESPLKISRPFEVVSPYASQYPAWTWIVATDGHSHIKSFQVFWLGRNAQTF